MTAAIILWVDAAAFTTGFAHAHYKYRGWGYVAALFCVNVIIWPLVLGKIVGELVHK